MSEHSPGPWWWSGQLNGDGDYTIWAKDRIVVEGAIESDADAYLIAAAPELLTALETLLRFTRDRTAGDFPQAEQAIAKARGES